MGRSIPSRGRLNRARHRMPAGAACVLAALFALGVSGPARAADPGTIGLDEIERGMTGYGESVFQGTRTERFEVEVLGVLRDIAPGTSYILARLTGHDLEKVGVVAGMSGSPVWIDGRLAGAVAIGWAFSQEAIAGITPIEAMRGIEHAAPWGRGLGAPRVALSELIERKLPEDLFGRLASPFVSLPGVDGRAAIEWGVGGFSPTALASLNRTMPAFAPTAIGRAASPPTPGAAAAGAEPAPLAGGSAVAAVLLDGDFRVAATGTVTERTGDRILAFGHPLFGLGEVSMPMAEAEIVTILGSSYSSFKLSNVGAVVGSFERDHAAGNLGHVGAPARTIPLSVRVASPEPRSFQMRMAAVPELMGVLSAISTLGAVDTVTAASGARGIDLRIDADLGDHGRLGLSQSFDGEGSTIQAVLFALGLVDYIARNDLAEVDLKSLDLELVPHAEPRADELLAVHALDRRLSPGEKTELIVELRSWRGSTERRRIPFEVPADAADGRLIVFVGDGASADAARFAIEPVVPQTFEQARSLLASLGSSTELSVLQVVPGRGALAGGVTHPRLPPSAASLLGSEPGGKPIRLAIAARDDHEQERPLSGLVRLDLEVDRNAPVRGESPGGANGRVRERPGS